MANADPDTPQSRDPVRRLIDLANALLDRQPPEPAAVRSLLDALEALPSAELLRFDEQSRSLFSGVHSMNIPRLRGGPAAAPVAALWKRITRGQRSPPPCWPPPQAVDLWHVLALASHDGFERERAARAAPYTRLATRLLLIRCLDWVPQVRGAALSRLDDCPHELLVGALPLADQLAARSARGAILGAFLDARLSDDDLREACRLDDARCRRAGWRRLAARGAASGDELREAAARDRDVVVRAVAADALLLLPVDQRRALAAVLVRDRAGRIAARALDSLVSLDGTPPILAALTGRSPGLRRAARQWAAIRGVDARSVYLRRLEGDPDDSLALTALAEMADPRDAGLFGRMLADGRVRVLVAGLRALARVDRPAARSAAVAAIESGAMGRAMWAAMDVLEERAPAGADVDLLTRLALERSRTPAQRLRALALLQPLAWTHLAVLLEARATVDEDDPSMRRRLDREVAGALRRGSPSRPLEPELRLRIERLLGTVEAATRRSIELALRTAPKGGAVSRD